MDMDAERDPAGRERIMKGRLSVRERLEVARGKFREYEGRLRQLETRLRQLEARLRVIQGHAQRAGGRARLRWKRLDRELRGTIDTTLARLHGLLRTVEPRVRRSLEQTSTLGRGLRAGIKAGVAAYRRSRSK
jgi:hypothetical protein